jgi:hypothetical protein
MRDLPFWYLHRSGSALIAKGQDSRGKIGASPKKL